MSLLTSGEKNDYVHDGIAPSRCVDLTQKYYADCMQRCCVARTRESLQSVLIFCQEFIRIECYRKSPIVVVTINPGLERPSIRENASKCCLAKLFSN